MKTSEFNKGQRLLRKKLDKITKEKIALSSKEKISTKSERKSVNTGPEWEGDKRFNARDKLPLE